MKHYIITALCIALLFSSCSLSAMDALIKKQKEIAQKQTHKALDQWATHFLPGIVPHISQPSSNPFVQLKLLAPDVQHDGITCGVRSLMFAKALDMIVEDMQNGKKDEKTGKNIEITPEDMHDKLEKLNYQAIVNEYLATLHELESVDFIPFIENHPTLGKPIDLDFFLLGFQAKSPIYPVSRSPQEEGLAPTEANPEQLEALEAKNQAKIAQLIDEVSLTMEEILPRLSELGRTKPLHFICCKISPIQGSKLASGHWVLISVMYYKGCETLWYIDPMNGNPTSWGAPFFIDYVITKIKNPNIKCLEIKKK